MDDWSLMPIHYLPHFLALGHRRHIHALETNARKAGIDQTVADRAPATDLAGSAS